MKTLRELVDYALCRVYRHGSCMIYPAKVKYPMLKYNGQVTYIHRLMYEFHYGPIPAKADIMHTCDTKGCINPEHLELGDHTTNARDAVLRGKIRSTTGVVGVSYQVARKRYIVMLGRGRDNSQCLYQGRDFFEACCVRKSWEAKQQGWNL